MSRSLVLVGLGLVLLLALPASALAASATLHYFDCKNCHKAGMAIGAMGAENTCLQCHANSAPFTDNTPAPAAWYDGIPGGRFNAFNDHNDLFGSATAALGSGTYTGQTHSWGVSDVKAAAGAKAPDKNNPLYAGFYSRYNASTGKVTCSRCHNPHGDADLGDGNILANPRLLIRDGTNANAPMQPDTMCRGCHVDLDKTDSLLINTHPMVANYAAAQAARPNDLRTQAEIDTFTSGHLSKVKIANGGVGCVSCHGVHYVDSNATTADGLANRASLQTSPGELLLSDGAHRTGPSRNAAGVGTAQLRSNLCQSCHKYELHGQGVSGDHKLGCLDCHNGHDPVGNTSDYMLRSASNGPVPTRINGTNSGPSSVTFNSFIAGDTRNSWADEVEGTANGFCERCHGDVNGGSIKGKAIEHQAGNGNQCSTCHKHNDPANLYSFNRDASAATCGQCHGFPPYLNSPGDRPPAGTGVDGGYAVNKSADPNTPYDYVTSTTHEKDESQTGHKVHAGRDLSVSPANTSASDWYFVGTAGIDNCKVCHGPDAGSSAGGHREAPATRPNTFRDVPFDGIAKHGGMNPSYNINSPYTCSNVYCHTNGAPYNGASRPNRNYSYVNVTPPWVGNGSNYAAGGYGSIHGQAIECAGCHGNSTATMGGGQKQNSAAHLAHLGGASTLNMGRVFSCSVCHVESAASSTALAVNAMDGRLGGKHVNGEIDVDFDPAGLNGDLATSTYAVATGVCSTYCHNVTGGGSAMVADWDLAATDMQCDSCHGGLATDSAGNGGFGPISSSSHARHVTDANGPTLNCDDCHGTNSTAGTPSAHLDGVVTVTAGVCTACHAVDGAETVPVWGQPSTSDCKSCHTGSSTSTIKSRPAPAKANALTTGHGKSSGSYSVTGLAAANRDCIACHDAASTGHFDGDLLDKRLVGGFTCEGCHDGTPAVAVKTHSNTDPAYTGQKRADFTKLCLACHDPHGSSNLTMIAPTKADFGGTVVFSSFGNAAPVNNDNSFDELNDSPVSNLDDICATCHTATAHNNRAMAGSHNEGKTCTTCHSHNGGFGGFMPTGGNACNDCHGNPPATGAHALHATSATHDKDNPLHDATDCAQCHTGAETYTYTAGGNHQNTVVNVSGAGWSDNGTPANKNDDTCASACHTSSGADGFWGDTGLGGGLSCTACHGNPPAGNNHAKHITAGMTCAGCHVGVEAQTNGGYIHNDYELAVGTNDGWKLRTRGNGYVNYGGLDVEVNDSAWNAGAGNTFVNGAGTTDNTCSNTLCHDPSNSGTIADFDTSTSSCTLCHGYGTTMTSGSHGQHVNNAAVIGDNFACTVCHPDNTVLGTDHTLTGGNVQGTVTVAGSKANTYGGQVTLPNSGYGTCTASQCHNDGKGANVTSPQWGRAPQSADNCTICHGAPPNNGDHGDGSAGHWQPARTALGLACASCHNSTVASNTAIKTGSLHLDGNSYNVAQGGTYNAVSVSLSYTQGSPSNCTASCHAANPKNWAPPTSCNGCHGNPPATGAHLKHTTVSDQTTAEDRSDCAQCHTGADSYGYTASGNHQNSTVDVAAGYNSGNGSCASACHLSTAAVDGFWSDANGLNCDACHYYGATPSGAANQAHAKVISASHNEHFNKSKGCTECHGTLENSGNPIPGPLTHITASGANQGAILAGKAAAAADEANVTRASMTFDDGLNSCAGGIGLGCHATGTPDWDVAINDCVSCHTDETTATVNPTSGLHNFTTATRHDDTLQSGGCVNCHDATSPSSLHMNGTLNDSAAATYTFNAGNAVTYATATGCQTSCHSDGGDWRRKWSGAADARPGVANNPGDAVCGNCHGDYGTGWRWNEANASTTDHTDPNGDLTDQMASNHGTCLNCHGWGSGAYDKTWGTGKHGDGLITMNGPNGTGSGYTDGTGGCAQSCHGDIAGRRMNSNSGWTANYGDYGAGSCFSCHGNGTNQYWPDGATYPDKAGRHQIHITRLAGKLGITLPGTDLEQKRMCAYCHNDASGIGGSGHNSDNAPAGVADVGAINPIWDVTNPPTVADAGSSFNTTDGSCASIDCHNNKALPTGTFGWRNATATTCTMCHTTGGVSNDPTSGLHNLTPTVSGQRHDQSVTGGCAACHGTIPTPGTSTHVNGAFTGNGTIGGDKTAMGLIAAYTATADGVGSCFGSPTGNAGCHSGAGDAGTWARKWDSTISGQSNGTECKGCHGGFAETDWTFGTVSNTTDGSVEHNRNWDGDANIGEVIGNHKDDLANTSRCNVCHVYGDAGYTWATNHRNGQLEMNSTRGYSSATWNCTSTCHISNTGKNLETSGWTINAVAGPQLACDSCHGGSGQYWPNNPSTAAGDYPNRRGRHDVHMQKLALKLGYTLPGSDAEQKAMCNYCHNDATGSGGSGHDTDRTAPSNVGGFNLIWNNNSDANGAYNATAPGTCSNIDCHNSQATTAGTFGWYDSGTSACLLCHNLGGAGNNPTSGLHRVTPTVSGAAGTHDDAFGSGGSCISCHSNLPAMSPTTTHPNGTFSSNGTLAGDRTNMGLFAAYTSSGTDNTGSCSGALVGGVGCHAGTGDAGTWARQWNSANATATNGNECRGCHGGFAGTDWTFGAVHDTGDTSTEHQYNWDGDANTSEVIGNHKDNAANATRCNICHIYADAPYTTGAFATYHRDGNIQMNSVVEYNTTNKNCTGACHAANNVNHNLDASGWPVSLTAGPAMACSSCHGGGTAQAGGTFNYWPDGTTYPDKEGTPNRHVVHITRLAARLGYTMGALTDAQQKTMCGYCHNDPAGIGGTGHGDAISPANVGSFKHIGTGAADGGTAGTYNATAPGTCSNIDCHNNKQTTAGTYGWANTGTSTCLMCHTKGGATNDPISGLHNVVPTITGQTHDDSFATGGTCTSCHTSLPAMSTTSTHINGAFTGNGTLAGDKTNMGLFSAYTATADNIGTCAGAAVGGASCHANIMDAGSWARKWDASIPGQTNGVECQGCHGGMNGNDWTFGNDNVTGDNSTSHNRNWDGDGSSEVIGNHKDNAGNTTRCNICHVYADAPYTTGAFATYHRNGRITMNSATTYSGTTWNCTQVCHVNNTNHNLEASASAAWATRGESVAGPALACHTCHGGGTANSGSGFNYWPDGTTYPDNAGGSGTNRHLAHITKLAAKLNYNMATLTDQQQKTMCAYCHPYTTNPGESGHNDNVSPADVTAAAFNPLWSAFTGNYPTTADGGTAAGWSTATQNCSGIDCHNNQATTGTWAWNSTGTSTCLMCHTLGGAGNNPTSGLHNVTPTVSGAAFRHDDSFSTSGTCASCHTTLPAVAPTSTHINGTFSGNGTLAGDRTNMGLFAAYTAISTANNGTGTCAGTGVNGTGCHAGASSNQVDGGTWARLWDSTVPGQSNGTECKGCHGGFTGSDWTFGGAASTTDNLVSHSRDWDGDATANEVYGNHSGSTQATACNICHVYGDVQYVMGTHHRDGNVQMNSTVGYSTTNRNCTNTCHDNNTNHNLEASGATVTALAGPALTCTGCHGGATPKAGVSSSSPHVTVGRAAGYNTFVACTECHPGGTRGALHSKNGDANVVAIANDTTMGINYTHLVTTGVNGFVLGGDRTTGTTEAEICWNCHTNDTYNLSVTKTTITFVDGGANPDTIVDSASGLGTFAVGKLVTISGSSQAGNNKTFPIVAVAANSISVPAGSLTADGTAGESVILRERISEWGVNTDTNGAASNYNFGGIYTSSAGTTAATNWATATSVASNTTYWISAVRAIGTGTQSFSYKTGRTQSTHAASSSGVSGLDAVANIRCSYCHDVHNTKTGSPNGAPYLRGTWMGSPYREDGAPQAGQTYATSATNHGSVPRATNATTTLGGYQIDQNNGNPTTGGTAAHTTAVNATWSLDNNAGLCIMCHTEGVDNLNKFGTASNAWIGTNGHSNAAIGGTGSARANIFTMSGTSGNIEGRFSSSATPALYTGSGTYRGAPRISYLNAGAIDDTTVTGDAGSDQRGYGFRSQDSGGYMFTPQVTTGSPYAYNGYNWGAHADDSAAQTQYHKFSCSKCHNPHASRLPRLMMTNCLDTRQNTWDDALSTISGTGVSTENASAKISQLTSAQNCHRLKNTAQGAGARGTGWNKVTPWTTEGTQTNGVIP